MDSIKCKKTFLGYLNALTIIILIFLLFSTSILVKAYGYEQSNTDVIHDSTRTEPDMFIYLDAQFRPRIIKYYNMHDYETAFRHYIEKNKYFLNPNYVPYHILIKEQDATKDEFLSSDVIFSASRYVLLDKNVIDYCNNHTQDNLLIYVYRTNTLIAVRNLSCANISDINRINYYNLNDVECEDIGGQACDDICFGNQVVIKDKICCIGRCKAKQHKTSYVFIVVILVLALIMLFFYFSYKKRGKLLLFTLIFLIICLLSEPNINASISADLIRQGYQRYRITTYYTPHESYFSEWYSGYDYTATSCYMRNPRLHYCCVPTSRRGFYEEVKCQGSGVTKNGLLCRYNTIKKSRYESMFSCMKLSSHKYGITATGTDPKPFRTIAVDPRVIPYGTEVEIIVPSKPNLNGCYIAEDTGSGIKGRHIDLYTGFVRYPFSGYGYLKIGCDHPSEKDYDNIESSQPMSPTSETSEPTEKTEKPEEKETPQQTSQELPKPTQTEPQETKKQETKQKQIKFKELESHNVLPWFVNAIKNSRAYYGSNFISLDPKFFMNYVIGYNLVDSVSRKCYPSSPMLPSDLIARCVKDEIKNLSGHGSETNILDGIDIIADQQDTTLKVNILSYRYAPLVLLLDLESLRASTLNLSVISNTTLISWPAFTYNNIEITGYDLYLTNFDAHIIRKLLQKKLLPYAQKKYSYSLSNLKLIAGTGADCPYNLLCYDVSKNLFVVSLNQSLEGIKTVFVLPKSGDSVLYARYLDQNVFLNSITK